MLWVSLKLIKVLYFEVIITNGPLLNATSLLEMFKIPHTLKNQIKVEYISVGNRWPKTVKSGRPISLLINHIFVVKLGMLFSSMEF